MARIGVAIAGLASVVQFECDKQFRLDDLASAAPAGAGRVVEDQIPGCGTNMFENGAQPVSDALGRFAPIGLSEAHVRERKRHHQHMQNHADPGDDRFGLTEIDLRSAGRPGQFVEPVTTDTVGLTPALHMALHRRIRAHIVMLGHQSVKNTGGSVALFARSPLIVVEPLVNQAGETGQHRARRAFSCRRWCR